MEPAHRSVALHLHPYRNCGPAASLPDEGPELKPMWRAAGEGARLMNRQTSHAVDHTRLAELSGWRQLRTDDHDGFVVVMRPVNRPGRGRFWCGPVDPDSSVTWLRHRDWLTGEVIVPERMAVFTSAWDATTAWAQHLADRRRRGVPVREFAHFFPLHRLVDWSRVPPWCAPPGRGALSRPRVSVPDRLELSGV